MHRLRNRSPDLAAPDLAALERALHQPAPKTFRDGTHRSEAPADTITRVQAHARRMGITRLGNITGLDCIGIPVAIAVRPKSRSISVFQGKGLGLQQAYASALMEAAEFYHAEDLDSRFLLASHKTLATKAALVDPADLCGNGRPFDRSRPIEWIEGYDLLQHEPCWVPAEIVHTDMTRPQTHDSGCFLRGSNGLASGNNLAEALSSAICEVVERDAVALWRARDLRDQAAGCHLNPESIDNVAARDLLARYARAGIGVRIWNVTSDVGMPTFVCHIREDSDDPNLGMRRFHGAGCHPDRGIALTRALTEAAQTRLAYINGARDDLPFEHYSAPDNAETAEALLDALEAARAPSEFGDLPHYDGADVGEDVRWELHRLSSIGIKRVVAVDLTREELGIPVVRVVIPGLEGDNRNPEYVPGRRSQPLHAHVGKWCWRRTRYIAGAPPTVSAPSADELAAPAIATFGNPVAVIFAGPSLPPSTRPDDPRLVWRPPARSGDVYRAALERPAAIGLIDGYFDAVPSVRHKEILWAIEQGIRVYGAASMGALRATELTPFGMIGVGRVFTMYCDGTLADDDEVAVAHGPEDTGYLQMTEPMVNVRATMQAAMRAGVIGADLAGHIMASAKALHHSVRTLPAILSRAAESGAVRRPLAVLHDRLRGVRVDQKRLDAHRMVDEIRDMLVPASVTCESAHVSLRAKRSNLAPALPARECFVPPRFARDPHDG